MAEEIDISHLFGDWSTIFNPRQQNDHIYEDGRPLDEMFTMTNREGVISYYLTIKGYTEKYLFGKIALTSANESGGVFSPKRFAAVCNEYGIRIKPIPQPDESDENVMAITKAYKIGE